jgi:hypothetical protein
VQLDVTAQCFADPESGVASVQQRVVVTTPGGAPGPSPDNASGASVPADGTLVVHSLTQFQLQRRHRAGARLQGCNALGLCSDYVAVDEPLSVW